MTGAGTVSDRRRSFLLEQPFWRAEADDPDLRWELAILETEPAIEGSGLEQAFQPAAVAEHKNEATWQQLGRSANPTARSELITYAISDDPAWHRVALVSLAGLGKTTTLEWLTKEINGLDGCRNQNLAVFLKLVDLPGRIDHFLDYLARDLKGDQDEIKVRDWLKRRRADGRLTFLLDSLDQADPSPSGAVIGALKKLATEDWQRCRIWISGRPYAFRTAQEVLKKLHPNIPWQFLRVGQLDEPECRQILETAHHRAWAKSRAHWHKPHVYDDLEPAGQRLSRVPRYARLIATLPAAQAKKLTTAAATYWAAYDFAKAEPDREGETGILDEGLKAKDACRLGWHPKDDTQEQPRDIFFRQGQIRLARDLLGALAFRMFQGLNGQPGPAFVIKENLNDIITEALNGFLDAKAYVDCLGKPIDESLILKDWPRLKALDSNRHFIFSVQEAELQWADITTMAFFAAYWACRWATPQQLTQTRKWIVDDLLGENQAYREFWRFAVDMPDDALMVKGKVQRANWLSLFEPLFDPSVPGQAVDSNGRPLRSTEFIYRAWQRIEAWNSKLEPQGEDLIERFRHQFQRLAQNGTLEQQQVAGTIIGGFKPIAEGDCPFGADLSEGEAGRIIRVNAFELHQWPVTNEMYELFQPAHADYRWKDWQGEEKAHPLAGPDGRGDDRCPVVNVSWYDAWAFAMWCGCRLPTEQEWEHALRKGTSTRFFFGESETDLPLYAHFDQDWDKGSTVPVDDGKRTTNDNDLIDMVGNVWEWCESLYKPGASGRVLRGGCWGRSGRFCRSADRVWGEPDGRYHDDGFRLAAVPVGAKPGGNQAGVA